MEPTVLHVLCMGGRGIAGSVFDADTGAERSNDQRFTE